MKLTVVIPFFNGKEYLQKAIASVIQNQRDIELELFLMDDGSVDGADAVARGYAAQEEWIHYERAEHGGVSQARNRAIGLASGEYLFFLDADDLVPAHCLCRMYEAATQRKLDIAIGAIEEFYPYCGTVYKRTRRLSCLEQILPWNEDLLWNYMILGKLYRRQFLLDHQIVFPELAYSEDGVFSMQAVYSAKRIGGVPIVSYLYRKQAFYQGSSVTQRCEDRLWKDFQSAHEQIERMAVTFLQTAPLEEAQKAAYLERVRYKYTESIIGAFYRKLWRCSRATESDLIHTLQKQKEQLLRKDWAALCNANPDLRLDPEVAGVAEYQKRPEILLLLDGRMKMSTIHRILESVVESDCPSVRTVVCGIDGHGEDLPGKPMTYGGSIEEYREQHEKQRDAVPEYLVVIDRPVGLHGTTLSRLYQSLQDGKAEVAFCKVQKHRKTILGKAVDYALGRFCAVCRQNSGAYLYLRKYDSSDGKRGGVYVYCRTTCAVALPGET